MLRLCCTIDLDVDGEVNPDGAAEDAFGGFEEDGYFDPEAASPGEYNEVDPDDFE